MKSIKFIALIISLLALFCSCSTTEHDNGKRKAKLTKLLYISSNNSYIPADSTMITRFVDTSFKAGDMIVLDDARYRILN